MKTKKFKQEFVVTLLFFITLIAALSTYLMLFKNAFHGIDISDEGMYLLSVHNVNDNMAFHNPFGDYTGLLYKLSAQRLWLFRIVGFIVLGTVGIYLSDSIKKFLPSDSPRITTWTVKLSGLLIGPFYYSIGILTPSYNWLNLVSLCLGIGAIIQLHHVCSVNRPARWVHLGFLSFAIWVGTFAKVSTGLGIFLIFLTSAGMLRRPIKEIIRQIGSLLLLLLAYAIIHHLFISSLGNVIEKLDRGQKSLEILDPQYSFSGAFNSFKSGSIDWLVTLTGNGIILPLLVCVLLSMIFRYRNIIENRYENFLNILIPLPILSWIFSWQRGDWTGVSARYNDQMWSVTHLLSLSILSVLIVNSIKRRFSLSDVLWFGVLLGVPVLYAFGSNNGFIMQITGSTGVIALIAIYILTSIQKIRESLLAVTCLVMSLGAFCTTISSARTPYRQAPLSQQSVLIEIARGSGHLYLEESLANEIKSLRAQLKTNGWKSRTPLLDLTQYSAGIVYALDAQQPITVIPTVGGMAGVNALAEWSLSYIAEHDKHQEWKSAWLLIPSEQVLSNCQLCPNISVLGKIGKSFPNDYQIVANSTNYRIYKPRE